MDIDLKKQGAKNKNGFSEWSRTLDYAAYNNDKSYNRVSSQTHSSVKSNIHTWACIAYAYTLWLL